jgi:hypothetical protein
MMRIKIKQHLGFLANITLALSTIVGVFLMTPLILKTYGQEVFLVWSLVNSACGLLLIVDFGITSVMARKFLELFQKPSSFSKKTWGDFLSFHAVILAIGSGLVIVVFLIQSSFGNVFRISTQNVLVFAFLLIATLSTIACHQQIMKFQILGRYPQALTFIAFSKIIETGFVLLLISWQPPFATIPCTVAAIQFFQFLTLRNLANRWLLIHKKKPSIIQKIQFSRLNLVSSVLYSASSILGIHATFILQSFFLAPMQVLTVLICRMIASPIRIFADSLAIGNFDKFIRKSLSSNARNMELKRSTIELWLLLLGFSVIYMFLINIVSNFVFTFLSQGQSTSNVMLLNLFFIATIMDGAIVIYMQISISGGSLGRAGSTYFLVTLMSLVFLVTLIQSIGIYAGVFSIIFCDTIFLLYLLKLKKSVVSK